MGDLPKWKRGRIKRAKKQLKQGFGKKIFLFLLLSIFKQTWVKLLHSVQKRYTTSPSREVQKWVTTAAPSLQCLRSKTCQVLRVVSLVKINCLIMLKLNAFPKQWSPYQVTCLSRKNSMFFIFRNGPIIEGRAHPKILRKLHALIRNGLNIGWQAPLKILRKLHAFLRNSLNIRWPAHLKILRKLHAFLRNGLNIRWPSHLKNS